MYISFSIVFKGTGKATQYYTDTKNMSLNRPPFNG